MKYATKADAKAAHAEQNRAWHVPFSAEAMPWRVTINGVPIAVFVEERDARGFAKARYGDQAVVRSRGIRPGGRRRGN